LKLEQKPLALIGWLMIIVCCGALSGPAWAASMSDLQLDANRIPWRQLSFHAKNFWVELSTNIQLTLVPALEVEAALLATPQGIPIEATRPDAYQMTIHTTLDPAFRSPVMIHNQIWFNPADAAALGRIRLRRGEDDFKKIYRFTEQGVFRHRIEPQDSREASKEPEKWTNTKDSFYPHDIGRLGCASVSEHALLIYILSAGAISNNNGPLSLCVFGKRQLHRVQLRPQGFQRLRVSYLEKTPNTERQRQRLIQALKIALTSEPMESDLNDTENFSFFGFHKDIAIYIDPTLGLPLRVSGIIPAFGKAHLELREINLRMQAD
jgi:hypothetical protein